MITGKMMHQQMTVGSMITHAGKYHGDTEVVSVETDGGIRRSNWRAIDLNARRLASALGKMGIQLGDRCATIAWNNIRHLEIYFGVASGGMVCHTINPRLHPEHLAYIINHAEDQVLFLDKTFLPVAAKLGPMLKTVKAFVLMGPRDEEAAASVPGLLFYDELLETGDPDFEWPDIDETSPASLCYTSGTTGNPKGVQYTHRSIMLHTLAGNNPDGMALSAQRLCSAGCSDVSCLGLGFALHRGGHGVQAGSAGAGFGWGQPGRFDRWRKGHDLTGRADHLAGAFGRAEKTRQPRPVDATDGGGRVGYAAQHVHRVSR